MTKNNFKFEKKTKGFTLIETLVAITILMIAIIGPMSIISRYFSDNNYARNQIIAAFLAQEGAETVTNIIRNQLDSDSTDPVLACPQDHEWLLGGVLSGRGGLSKFTDIGKIFDVNSFTQNLVECSSVAGVVCDKKMKQSQLPERKDIYEPGDDIDDGVDTIFYRGIKIEDITSSEALTNVDVPLEAKITSSVSWDDKSVREPIVETVYIVSHRQNNLECSNLPTEPLP